MLVEIIVIILFSLITRLPFLSLQNTDYYAHLWFVRLYEKGMKFGGLAIKHGLFEGDIGNPPIPYYFYSKLPENRRILAGVLSNLFYDGAAAVVVYCFFHIYLPGSAMIDGFPLSIPCVGALLYSTTPLLHPLSARLLGLGSRTLGNLLIVSYFICLAIYISSGISGFLLLPVLFCLIVLIMFSSKFGLQQLVFISAVLSLVSLDIMPIGIVIVGIFVTLMIPGTDVRGYLRTRFSHAKWYVKAIRHNTMSLQLTTVYRGQWKLLLKLPRMLKDKTDFCFWLLFTHVPFFIMLYSIPAVFVLMAMLLPGSTFLVAPGLNTYGMYVIFSSFAIAVITSFRPWIVFGEAERYTEAALPFIYLLIIQRMLETGSQGNLWVLLMVNIFIIFFNITFAGRAAILSKFHFKKDEDFETLLQFMNTLSDEKRIVTTPIHLSASIDVNTDKPFSFYFHLHSPQEGLNTMFRYYYNRFMFNLEFDTAHEELGADTFILARSYRQNYEDAGLIHRLNRAVKIYENNTYQVFSFPEK